jgi:hypothetical protein
VRTLHFASHTNLSPGRKLKKTRRRKRRRKRRKPLPPLLLLMFQQIHQLLIRWTTNGAASPLLARRRKARKANSLSLNLCQNPSQNRLLNRSPNRSLHQLPRPQRTTCGDFLRPARRRRARKARSVKSLLFMYLASGASRIGVSPPDGVIIRAAPRASGQGWVAELALRITLHTASNPNVSLCAREAHATPPGCLAYLTK